MDPRVSESQSAKCADFNVPNYVKGTLANFSELKIYSVKNQKYYKL